MSISSHTVLERAEPATAMQIRLWRRVLPRLGVQQRQLQRVVSVKALHALGVQEGVQVFCFHVHVQLTSRHDRAHDRALNALLGVVDDLGGVLARLGLAAHGPELWLELWDVHTLHVVENSLVESFGHLTQVAPVCIVQKSADEVGVKDVAA